jgi:hypothetical protein
MRGFRRSLAPPQRRNLLSVIFFHAGSRIVEHTLVFSLRSISSVGRITPATTCSGARGAAQLQRFELKYLVSERIARAMRQFVRCHLVPDEFAANSADHAYAVHTLYLDSPDLALYGATNSGDCNRFKLRVRFYDDAPEAPAFFEIKGRRNESIFKLRSQVRREAAQALLKGEWPALRHLVAPDAKQFLALQEFCRRLRALNATPRSHVAYRREAWASRGDNSLRVTFDRQVQCEPQFSGSLRAAVSRGDYVEPFESSVICEIKFTQRWPSWCGEFVRAFGLVRSGAAKYAEGVARMGEHRVSNRGVGLTCVAPTAAREPDWLISGHTVQPV